MYVRSLWLLKCPSLPFTWEFPTLHSSWSANLTSSFLRVFCKVTLYLKFAFPRAFPLTKDALHCAVQVGPRGLRDVFFLYFYKPGSFPLWIPLQTSDDDFSSFLEVLHYTLTLPFHARFLARLVRNNWCILFAIRKAPFALYDAPPPLSFIEEFPWKLDALVLSRFTEGHNMPKFFLSKRVLSHV